MNEASPAVFAAADVHYLPSGGARAAAVLAADAVFYAVLAERTVLIPQVLPYRPGEFFLRELPPLRAVLAGVPRLGLLVIDGYADLDPAGRPGLGAHARAAFGVPVIGVAKTRFPPPPTRAGASLSLFGQEKNVSMSSIARLNLLLNGPWYSPVWASPWRCTAAA